MKTKLIAVCATLMLASSLALNAGEAGKPKPATTEFQKLKGLVGTWQGKVDIGQGLVDMTVQYRLLAGGTVLEERVFPGTPNEMVTMFYEKDGTLALTHYCMMGNRPAMQLTSSDSKTLKFDFDKSCGINTATESHMHALTISFDDADTVTTSCTAILEGKTSEPHPTTLKRVKS